MAKKKKGGTRTVSRKEREERLRKPEEPFGPKRYLKDKGVNILLSAVILAVLCAVANVFMPGNYVVPGTITFIVMELVLYWMAWQEDRMKQGAKQKHNA